LCHLITLFPCEVLMAKPMEEYRWYDLNVGCVIDEPGNAREYKTGDWRSQRPIHLNERCRKCYLCWLFCPDAAVYMREDGFFDVNLDYCKGCGICSKECPFGAIEMKEETK